MLLDARLHLLHSFLYTNIGPTQKAQFGLSAEPDSPPHSLGGRVSSDYMTFLLELPLPTR